MEGEQSAAWLLAENAQLRCELFAAQQRLPESRPRRRSGV